MTTATLAAGVGGHGWRQLSEEIGGRWGPRDVPLAWGEGAGNQRGGVEGAPVIVMKMEAGSHFARYVCL